MTAKWKQMKSYTESKSMYESKFNITKKQAQMILDLKKDELKKMSYDGRDPNIPWRNQNITSMGYHYYMTPETAKLGIEKLPQAIADEPKQWIISEWPDLREMDVFKDD